MGGLFSKPKVPEMPALPKVPRMPFTDDEQARLVKAKYAAQLRRGSSAYNRRLTDENRRRTAQTPNTVAQTVGSSGVTQGN